MGEPIPAVDGYIRKNKQWSAELSVLRTILLDSELTEDVKWRVPCYTLDGANVVLLTCLKASCVIGFTKGALLKDPHGVLVQQTENSQTVRVIKFANVDQIKKLTPVLKAYVKEAIAVEKAGLKVEFKKIDAFAVPEEFQSRLDADTNLEAAFEKLTPGRRRAYLMHFAGAKQSKTRAARVDKCVPRILDGKGLDDE